jgi:hypothetical protein
MTPKYKAEELLNKMLSKNPNRQDGISMIDTIQAKLCAIVAVDEILLTLNKDIRDLDVVGNVLLDLIEYWQEVKKEIENI